MSDIYVSYAELKAAASKKRIAVQVSETANAYELVLAENGVSWRCNVFKDNDTRHDPVILADYLANLATLRIGEATEPRAVDGSMLVQPIVASGQVTQPPLPITGSMTVANIVAVTGSLSSTVTSSALPLGAASEVTLSGRLSEATFTARFPTQGQKVKSGSVPVVLASDQGTLPVSQVSQPLPTGASTETTQALLLKEATYTTRQPVLGQATMAASVPVTLASNQSTLPVSQVSQPLPSGAATETTLSAVSTKVATETTLASINTKTPVQGQGTMATSSPVVIASNQSTLPVSQVSQPLPTGASTEATLAALNTKAATETTLAAVNTKVATEATLAALNTKAATETTLATLLKENTFLARIPTLGQKSIAGSIPVVMAAGQPVLPVSLTQGLENATFIVTNTSMALSLNRSLLSLHNGAGSNVLIKVQALYIVNTQNATVTGVLGTFQVKRCTGHSGGTLNTPQPFDTADTLNPLVTCRDGATIAGESTQVFWDNTWSTDEWTVGSQKDSPENMDHAIQARMPMWQVTQGSKPFTLRPGEGLTVKFITNTTIGSYDVKILFTQETIYV